MEINQTICDFSLNVAEKAAVNASLIEIKLNENFSDTKFWGKVFGIERDYLVIHATKTTHEIEHKYFFSVDNGLSFSQLPIVEPWMNEKCMQIAGTFTGTTSHIYERKRKRNADGDDAEDDDEEEANADEDENDDRKGNESGTIGDEPPAVVHKLTELDRLAWTISRISEECLLVCRGAMRLTSKKLIDRNPYFRGLTKSEANSLESYLHWRTPSNPYSVSKYRKATAMNDSEFLDPITNDLPIGCWRLRALKNGLEVEIRNLLWSGFAFHYSPGNRHSVQAYFGYGIRQNDLVFMI
jgi:hypothetical protein